MVKQPKKNLTPRKRSNLLLKEQYLRYIKISNELHISRILAFISQDFF